MGTVDDALESLRTFAPSGRLGERIGRLEVELSGEPVEKAAHRLAEWGIDEDLLQAAIDVKHLAGQINVIVHAVGILVSIPHLLEPGEQIESLSLGAGNTGRDHDLETDRRIAEFKFIEWRGGAESIRQNSLFIDLFNLASSKSPRRKYLYVIDKSEPLRFLGNRRAIGSVLSKNAAVAKRFENLHGDRFQVVRDYYSSVRDLVEIVDLRDLVPAFAREAR